MNRNRLDFTAGFSGDVLGPVPVDDAVQRVVAFCCSPQSGFLGYDLAGSVARTTGKLTEVGPWTILPADALAGRVTVGNVHGFTCHLRLFAELLAAVPDKDLALLNDRESADVAAFCSFGFPGAWAPKITKAGAMFRPRAIPILDGYLALAFGYSRDALSAGSAPRRRAIAQVIQALSARILADADELSEVRRRAGERVPAVAFLSDLRLADIVIWTSQDDRIKRPGKPRDAWLKAEPGEPPTIADAAWLPLAENETPRLPALSSEEIGQPARRRRHPPKTPHDRRHHTGLVWALPIPSTEPPSARRSCAHCSATRSRSQSQSVT